MSTASMGRFDKKVSKNEPDAPTSQKLKKKKSNAQLDKLSKNTSEERARNLKIFDLLQRKAELGSGNYGSKSKANAHIDEGKVARKAKKKDDSKRRKIFA